MTKEEEIKAWFDKNKIEIFNESVSYDMLIHLFKLIEKCYKYNDLMCVFKFLLEKLLSCSINLKIDSGLLLNDVIIGLKETLLSKNKKYGNSFDKTVDKHGIVAFIIRLEDKINRLDTIANTEDIDDEDTLLDIAGYCVLALIYLENKEYK